jgi:hypothetical protein
MKVWIISLTITTIIVLLTFGLYFSIFEIRKQARENYRVGFKDGEYFGGRNMYFHCLNHEIYGFNYDQIYK